MPQIRNYTPYANFRYYSLDNRGEEFGIVIVKATFEILDDGRLERAEEQVPLVFTDECHGAVNETSVRHPSDLVPYKPQGEVIVNAVARAPRTEPMDSWLCGLSVDGDGHHLEKALRVTGQRWWRPKWKRKLEPEERAEWREHRDEFEGWELTDPKPALAVPLRWEFAYGGTLTKEAEEGGGVVLEANEHNPIGTGWIDEDATNHTKPMRAPSLEDPMRPVSDPYEQLTPQNLGPIPPAWLPRRPLGGTYDEDWKENVWPKWPADYDFAYHLSSPADLRWPGFFRGTERITLRNMLHGRPEAQLTLPGEFIEARFVTEDGRHDSRVMNLDTIFLDLAVQPWDPSRVYLVWRIRFDPEVFERVELGVFSESEIAALG